MKAIHTNITQGTREARKECRERIDLLRSRIHLLSGRDRLLMTMYLDRGNSIRQLARLIGIDDTILARRIRRLAERLLDGQYIDCLRNRNRFTTVEMAIARDYFLTGLSIKTIAAEHGFSYYRTRETIRRIQRLLAAIRQQEPAPKAGAK